MDLEIILLNIYYLGVAAAFLVRDILWLRIIIIAAISCAITYGILSDNQVVIIWNSLFITINGIQVTRLIYERRPVPVNEAIKDIYNNLFSEMTIREFIYFWEQGFTSRSSNKLICSTGIVQENLHLLLSGIATVRREGHEVAHLVRGNFIGEMGFILGGPATADVFAEGTVEYMTWSRDTIDRLQKSHPELINKLQKIIAIDLVNKLLVINS